LVRFIAPSSHPVGAGRTVACGLVFAKIYDETFGGVNDVKTGAQVQRLTQYSVTEREKSNLLLHAPQVAERISRNYSLRRTI